MSVEIGYTDPKEFNYVIKQLRSFFDAKGFLEVHEQSRLSILAACEDPKNLASFNYAGRHYPLPQTGQLYMEYDLLKNPTLPGLYTLSTSYRNEESNDPRYQKIFGLFEFEMHGGFNDLLNIERELCEHLGYGKKESFPESDYIDVADKYGVKELGHEHEQRLYEDNGPVFLLTRFPEFTSPYWNMARNTYGTANKCDVILSGVECFGTAERSCDPLQMRHNFETITNGEYAKTLYAQFGRDRVINELNAYLKLPMVPRCGGGIGITRLIKSMNKEKLI